MIFDINDNMKNQLFNELQSRLQFVNVKGKLK